MPKSNLPRKHIAPKQRDVEREELLPYQHVGEPTYPGGMFMNQNTMSGPEQFAKLLDMLIRRKWYFIFGFLTCMGIATATIYMSSPLYETSSFVMVDLGNVTIDVGKQVQSEDDDAAFQLFARSDRTLSGEIRLLQISDQLAQRVDNRIRSENSAGNTKPRGKVNFVPERGADNILRFVGTSTQGEHAAQLSNLYAEEYVKLTEEASRSHTLALITTLEEQEKEQLAELTMVEERINLYKQSGGGNLDQETARLVQQVATLDVQREDLRIELEVEEAELASREEELATINPQLAVRIASGVEQRIQTLQTQLNEEEDALATILRANPDLRNTDTDALADYEERITVLKAEIDSLSSVYVSEVTASGGISGSADGIAYTSNLRQIIAEKKVNISRMQARLSVLTKRIETSQAAIRRLPSQSIELAQLERTRSRVEMKYENTAQQLQLASIAGESESGYANIISRAQIPGLPTSSDPIRNLILGAFLGLMLGFALVVVRDKMDTRLYQPDQLRKLGLKEIGVVPDMKPQIKQNYKGEEFLEHDGKNMSTSLIPLLEPISAASESYRHIRTNIHFSIPDVNVQTLLVVSPGISEGKSTSAANLAIVMAQSGRKTLLIDADLRRPKQHHIFGLPLDAGLIELLSDSSYFDPASWRTSINNLSVLTAGSPLDGSKNGVNGKSSQSNKDKKAALLNPSEMLGSEQMHRFISVMRKQYDIIIIDTPPVLIATDATLLSTQADATMIVVRSGVTKEGDLVRAVETLEDVSADIIGVLLNGYDAKKRYGQKYLYQEYGEYGRYGRY